MTTGMTAHKSGALSKLQRYLLPSFIVFSYHFSFRMFFAFVPIHLKETGLTQGEIGALFSLIPLALIAFTAPFGLMSDRYPPGRAAAAGMVVLGASVFMMRHAGGVGETALLFAGIGAGTAMFRTNMNSLYLKTMGAGSRSMKLAVFNSLQQFGYGLGPFVGGYLLLRTDLREIFAVSAAVLAPFVALSFLLPRAVLERPRMADYAVDLRKRSVWCFLLIVFVFAIHFGVEDVCFTLFMKENLGMGGSAIGNVFLVIAVTLVFFTLVSGWAGGRAAVPPPLLYCGLLLSGTFNFSMLFVHSVYQLLAVKVLHVAGDAMYLLFFQIALAELFPSARVGAPVGLTATLTIAGTLAGCLIGGALPGYALPFGVAGALTAAMALVAALFFSFLRRERT
ncbi:MAG: MFS transporter [bacterium]